MVLSGSKRTSSISSVVNQNSGGGSKKAGLPYQIGRSSSISIAFKQTSQFYGVLKGMKIYLKHILDYMGKIVDDKTAIRDKSISDISANIATATALENVTVDSTNTNEEIGTMISNLNVSGKKANLDAVAEGDDNSAELAAYNLAKTAADALNAILDARAELVTHEAELVTATTNKTTAQTNYDNQA